MEWRTSATPQPSTVAAHNSNAGQEIHQDQALPREQPLEGRLRQEQGQGPGSGTQLPSAPRPERGEDSSSGRSNKHSLAGGMSSPRSKGGGVTPQDQWEGINPQIVEWMLGTFMPGDGEIERTALHEMYLKFCRDNQVNTKILNNAGFGKIVKQLFPDVTYRRLGGRDTGPRGFYCNLVPREGKVLTVKVAKRKPRKRRPAEPSPAEGEVEVVQGPNNSTPMQFIREDPTKQVRKRRNPQAVSKAPLPEEITCFKRRSGHNQLKLWAPNVLTTRAHTNAHLGLQVFLRQCRDSYRAQLYSLTPINPVCMKSQLIDYVLFNEDGVHERSPLSFSCLLVLSGGLFLENKWDYAREFFDRALDHFHSLSDPHYDTAATLVKTAWWSSFYAQSASEGKSKKIQLLRRGIDICRSFQAYNDLTHTLLVSLEASHTMKNVSAYLQQASTFPKYNNHWKEMRKFRPKPAEWMLHKKATSMMHHIMPAVALLKSEGSLPLESKYAIQCQISYSRDVENEIESARNNTSILLPDHSYYILKVLTLALRTMAYRLLDQLPQLVDAALHLFKLFLKIPLQYMLINIHELSANEYALIRCAVDALAGHRILHRMWVRLNTPGLRNQFYWLEEVHDYIEKRMRAPITLSDPPLQTIALESATPNQLGSSPATRSPQPHEQPIVTRHAAGSLLPLERNGTVQLTMLPPAPTFSLVASSACASPIMDTPATRSTRGDLRRPTFFSDPAGTERLYPDWAGHVVSSPAQAVAPSPHPLPANAFTGALAVLASPLVVFPGEPPGTQAADDPTLDWIINGADGAE